MRDWHTSRRRIAGGGKKPAEVSGRRCQVSAISASAIMEFVIRNGERADLPRLSDIERDAALRFLDVDDYRFCVDGPVRDNEEFGRGLDRGALLVGETNAGTAIGFALLWRVDGNAHLTELNVERCHQGRGLGRLLVSHAETWARAQAFKRITLTTFRDISWNMPFYQVLGYSVFNPGPGNTGMAAIVNDEISHGFRTKPRVFMHKHL